MRGGSGGLGGNWTCQFTPCADFPSVPTVDVVSACIHYTTLLVEIVFDCYVKYGERIDPHQYYTREAFERRGLTVEDAESELFGWFLGQGDHRPSILQNYIPLDYRWQMIRDSVPGCEICGLFEEYLGQTKPGPARLEPPPPESIPLPGGWTRKDQWFLPPGYDDINTYLDELKAGRAPRNW